MKRIVLLLIVTTFLSAIMHGQCINCENTQNNGVNSSAIGKNTQATGIASFASGLYSNASGDVSTSIGFRNVSEGIYSTTIGNFLKATVSHAMVIGDGDGIGYELINSNAYSLMVGFNSNLPTLFVGTSNGSGETGKIGIGDVTDPEAKLHIRSDDDEAASLYLQPSNWNAANNAELWLGNQNHGISADIVKGLVFDSEHDYIFNTGSLGLQTDNPSALLDVNGTARIRSLSGEGERVVVADSSGQLSTTDLTGQQCIECNYSTSNGGNASVIGPNNSADGNGSTAIGTDAHTTTGGINTIAIGGMVTSDGPYSFVFGTGASPQSGKRLVNNIQKSLMIGFNSTKPTLFISTSPVSFDYNKTGKVGIGNVTNPEAKLHIRSDDDEAATLYLQPSNWNTENNAEIWLGNQNHGISVDTEEGMIYQTEQNHVFKSGDVYIENIEKGIIMKSPDGRCWRGTLDNSGNLNFTVLEVCPGTPTSLPENNTEEADNKVKVYPNPGTSMLTIQTKMYPCLFELYNANGQPVLKQNVDQAVKNIETSNLPVGVYTWIITKDDKVIDKDKWIKASNIQ